MTNISCKRSFKKCKIDFFQESSPQFLVDPKIKEDIDEVEGEPGDGEDQHHRNQQPG